MYRGREGQWAFILHRITGVAIILYLLAHVGELTAAMIGPKYSNAILHFFHQPLFQLGLLAVIGAVLYHALNGLRIILMDFTSWGTRVQDKLWYGVLTLFALLYIPTVIKILPEIFGGR
ncbi:succinate dehydrogenase, cytochrome b556 subunit [Oceanithermus sp.]|uniref:succinate dehydrogenase, cytochrome b556 subunit n=1 Tax=Oceanithermus sp. TaxID=2268145 RepID=UPI0025D1E2C1|nr:succinate dehydrogenase, cytochrome b556 subunit [Oceanithermus sp.]